MSCLDFAGEFQREESSNNGGPQIVRTNSPRPDAEIDELARSACRREPRKRFFGRTSSNFVNENSYRAVDAGDGLARAIDNW